MRRLICRLLGHVWEFCETRRYPTPYIVRRGRGLVDEILYDSFTRVGHEQCARCGIRRPPE